MLGDVVIFFRFFVVILRLNSSGCLPRRELVYHVGKLVLTQENGTDRGIRR